MAQQEHHEQSLADWTTRAAPCLRNVKYPTQMRDAWLEFSRHRASAEWDTKAFWEEAARGRTKGVSLYPDGVAKWQRSDR
jgi:hypothetical protein